MKEGRSLSSFKENLSAFDVSRHANSTILLCVHVAARLSYRRAVFRYRHQFAGARDAGATLAVSPSEVGLTMSAFMLSLAVAPLLYGPFSDRFGRKPVVARSVSRCLWSRASPAQSLSRCQSY
jgi:MFS family permease